MLGVFRSLHGLVNSSALNQNKPSDMRYTPQGRSSFNAGWFSFTSCWLAAAAVIAVGCSSENHSANRSGFTRVITPLPPPFLTGPAALLLTNSPGFSARADLQTSGSLSNQKAGGGELLGRGGKLFYAPEAADKEDNQRKPGAYSFIWDVNESRGFVLSEALQGYAPITADLHVTNIETAVGKTEAQRFAGHPSEPGTVTLKLNDGSAVTYEVLRAIDLNAFPVRIESATNSISFVLNLSKIRLESPAAELFSPPDGFTKYPTPEAMADELAARQNNLRRKNLGQPVDLLPETQPRRY
jgi:hypothetical protein